MWRKFRLSSSPSALTALSLSGRRCWTAPTRMTFVSSIRQPDDGPNPTVSFRKTLKDRAKGKTKDGRRSGLSPGGSGSGGRTLEYLLREWDLTVGIEIHAELNSATKLFSPAPTTAASRPNSHVAPFDLAFPGSIARFEPGVVIPALRAAIALNCHIQRYSSFDRKHYFYHDQPAGYQITQYYHPFATDGFIDIPLSDGSANRVRIERIQLEQDTARSAVGSRTTRLLDFNRSSHPLIEIVSAPDMKTPAAASGYVRRIHAILATLDALNAGIELGGLRADVNVSVRPRSSDPSDGLGQRTEIKNLGSIKAVELATEAEMRRQIDILDKGGKIESETRGWTIGMTTTRPLRRKEAGLDYRFMPDADLGPLLISDQLCEAVRATMPILPDAWLARLSGLIPVKDARTLIGLDSGDRLEYFLATVDGVRKHLGQATSAKPTGESGEKETEGAATATTFAAGMIERETSNWVIHQLGALFTAADRPWTADAVPASALAAVVSNLLRRTITPMTAKQLVGAVFGGETRPVDTVIVEDGLEYVALTDLQYSDLADRIVSENETISRAAATGRRGKLMWLVGQMVRAADSGRVEPQKAETALTTALLRFSNDTADGASH